MFEYNEEFITSAQSDLESGIGTINDLITHKTSLLSLNNYYGKDKIDSFLGELENINTNLETIDNNILFTKENIESVDISNVFETSEEEQMYAEIMMMINSLPLTEEQKAEALRLLSECSVRSSYAYLCVISCEQEIEYYKEILGSLYGSIANPYFDPEKNPADAIISNLIDAYLAYIEALASEKRQWENSLKLWKYDFLDKTDLSDVGNIFETTIGPILSCLYNADGSLSLPYEEWGVMSLNARLITQFTSLQEQSVLDFAMYMYQDEGYRNWYYQEHGEQLTKDDVLLYLGLGTVNNSEASLQTRAFLYMNDEEYSKYKWLYANKGADEAQEYLNAIENDINAQHATDLFFEDVDRLLTGASSDSAFIRQLEVFGINVEDGIMMWADNIATTFNGNTNYTVTEYKQMMMSKLLVSGLACAPLTQTDLDMQLENGEITQEQYAELTGSKKSVTTLDVMLLRGEISNQEYEQYKVILDDPSFKSLSEKIGASERKAMGYISTAGTSVGNMIPSVLASACITMAGGGGAAALELGKTVGTLMMWTAAYGSSYKTGVRSGQSEQRAMLYAALSATTEAVGERYLGAIPFIGDGSKVVNLDSKILSLIVNGAANLGKEVVQEEIQGVFLQNMIDAVVLGKEINLEKLPQEMWDTAITTAISTIVLGGVGGTLNTGNQLVFNLGNDLKFQFDADTIVSLKEKGIIKIDDEGNLKIVKMDSLLTSFFVPQANIYEEYDYDNQGILIGDKIIKFEELRQNAVCKELFDRYGVNNLLDTLKIARDGGFKYDNSGNIVINEDIVTSEYIRKLLWADKVSSLFPTGTLNVRTLNYDFLPEITYNISDIIYTIKSDFNYENFIDVLQKYNYVNNGASAIYDVYHKIMDSGLFSDIDDEHLMRFRNISTIFMHKYYEAKSASDTYSNRFNERFKYFNMIIKDNICFTVPNDFDENSYSFSEPVNTIIESVCKLPNFMKEKLENILIYDEGEMSHFNSFFLSMDVGRVLGSADSSKNSIYFNPYLSKTDLDITVAHEATHIFDKDHVYSSSQEWTDAIKADNIYPTDYSKSCSAEDFAESVAYFLDDPYKFKRLFPNRTAYLESIMPELKEYTSFN